MAGKLQAASFLSFPNDWPGVMTKAIERDWALRHDVLAMAVAEERKRERAKLKAALDELRAELAGKAHERGRILDLAALPVVRKVTPDAA